VGWYGVVLGMCDFLQMVKGAGGGIYNHVVLIREFRMDWVDGSLAEC
jgi:hypothetical protein